MDFDKGTTWTVEKELEKVRRILGIGPEYNPRHKLSTCKNNPQHNPLKM
jgi:hypothetical protein